jgi:hypothetical protein
VPPRADTPAQGNRFHDDQTEVRGGV